MPVINRKQLAELAGVTPQRISQYAAEGMPRISPSEYDSDKCLKWLKSVRPYARESDTPEAGDDPWSMSEERLGYMRAQRIGQEQKNAEHARVMVPRAEVVAATRERDAAIIAEGDVWASNATTSYERKLKTDLWHALRRVIRDTAGSVGIALASVDTVGATRTRIRRNMGDSKTSSSAG